MGVFRRVEALELRLRAVPSLLTQPLPTLRRQEIEQALAEMPALLPFLLFPDKPLLSFGTLKTTLRDALVVSVTVVTMMFAARLWDFLVILVLKYGMSALVGQPPLPHT